VFDEHGSAEIMDVANALLMRSFQLSLFLFNNFYYVFKLNWTVGTDVEGAHLELIGTRCFKTYDQVVFDATTRERFKICKEIQ